LKYPNTPGHKSNGASLDAAVAMRAKAPTIRERVLIDITANGPSTPTQIAKRTGITFLSVRPRVSELIAAGKIIKSEATRESPHGATEHYYALPSGDIPAPSKPDASPRKRLSEMTADEAASAAEKAMSRYGCAYDRGYERRRAGRCDKSATDEAKRHMDTYRACMRRVEELRVGET